jgi:hypothetical protein
LAEAAKGNLKALYDLIYPLINNDPNLDTSGIETAYTDANAAINK